MNKIKSEQELKDFIASAGMTEVAVLKIGAPWCGPCRTLEGFIKEIEDKASFAEVDIDEVDEAFLDTLKVRSVPVLDFYWQGALVTHHVGLMTKQAMLSEIERLKTL